MRRVEWRDYVDMRFEAEHRSADAAYQQMEKRLDGMNEFRAALDSQADAFVPRTEFEQVRKLVYMALGIAVAVPVIIAAIAAAM